MFKVIGTRAIKAFLYLGLAEVVIGLLSSIPLGLALSSLMGIWSIDASTTKQLLITGCSGVVIAFIGVVFIGISRASAAAEKDQRSDDG
jgi:hypothetical protein